MAKIIFETFTHEEKKLYFEEIMRGCSTENINVRNPGCRDIYGCQLVRSAGQTHTILKIFESFLYQITMQTQAMGDMARTARWIPLTYSIGLIFRRKRLFSLSVLLFGLTALLTWGGYQVAIDFVDSLTRDFFAHSPEPDSILGWIKHKGWIAAGWLYSIISRIVSFYLAFLVAYTLSTPGYSFLSSAAEKVHAGQYFDEDAAFTFFGILVDIWEGFRVAMLGILVTITALLLNFVPAIGQAGAFVLYVYYSAIMFVDYPASRRRWSLGHKIDWIRTYPQPVFRLGLLPALVSMIPVLNIFLIALLFPLLTIHSAVNFAEIEATAKQNGGNHHP